MNSLDDDFVELYEYDSICTTFPHDYRCTLCECVTGGVVARWKRKDGEKDRHYLCDYCHDMMYKAASKALDKKIKYSWLSKNKKNT